jgi:hypothetical protein
MKGKDLISEAELEKRRRKASGVWKLFGGLSVLCILIAGAAICAAVDGLLQDNRSFIYIGLGVIGVSGILSLIFKRISKTVYNKFNKEFKDNSVRVALSEIMTVINFEPEETYDNGTIDEANLFSFVKKSGNDLLEAEYNGYHFTQCDLELIDEFTKTDKDGDTYKTERTVFKGRFMIIDYDIFTDEPVRVFQRAKKLSERQLMRELEEDEPGLPSVGEFVAGKIMSVLSPGFEKDKIIRTESTEFDSRFEIKTKSPVDALRVLTPQMITGILEASDRLKGELRFAFANDKIYFAYENKKDLMEADKSGGKTIAEQKVRIQNEIKVITDFLDTFPLMTTKS